MANTQVSFKHLQISKANLVIVIVIAAACFTTIFSLTASKVLIQQQSYQAKVIKKKTVARNNLEANLKARDKLVSQYKAFVGTPLNVIGGSSTGSGDRDGDNAKIVLDALPSQYDYPALATSLEKILLANSLTITSITGNDDELNQANVSASNSPVPVEMPFQFSFEGPTQQTESLFDSLQRSIRPLQVESITISGNDQKLTTSITAKTYFQPAKSLKITSEVVK